MEYTHQHGSKYFECQPLHATLSIRACADNFSRKRCLACLQCPLGRLHAEEVPAPGYIPHKSEEGNCRSLVSCLGKRCIRCGNRSVRVLAQSFCPGCWNRTLEVCRGRNAKGGWPTKIAAMHRAIRALIECDDSSLIDEFLQEECTDTKALRFSRYSSNALWFEGVLCGTEELKTLLKRVLPDARVVEIEALPILSPPDIKRH